MKKKDFIFGLVGLILIFGVVIGLVVWLNRSGDSATPDDTTKPSGTSGIIDGSDSDKNSDSDTKDSASDTQNTQLGFYESGDLGFKTVNGVTTFYVIVEGLPTDGDGYYCAEKWIAHYDDDCFYSIPGYTLAHKFSIDDGETWHDFNHDSIGRYRPYIGDEEIYIPTDKEFLVAYTQIENCENPMNVMNDLKNKVFNTTETKNVCCGNTYTYYPSFEILRSHLGAPGPDGNLG